MAIPTSVVNRPQDHDLLYALPSPCWSTQSWNHPSKKSYRYRNVTVPLPYRYRTNTVPLPYQYGSVTVPYQHGSVTVPLPYRYRTVPLPYHYRTVTVQYRYRTITVPYTNGTGKTRPRGKTRRDGRQQRDEKETRGEFTSEVIGTLQDNAPNVPNKTVVSHFRACRVFSGEFGV